jgi:GntR family transcriptional regulator
VSVVRISERLRAIAADAEVAALLAVPPGSPLLQIRRVAMSYNDAPVELRVSRVNTQHHEYFSDIGRS